MRIRSLRYFVFLRVVFNKLNSQGKSVAPSRSGCVFLLAAAGIDELTKTAKIFYLRELLKPKRRNSKFMVECGIFNHFLKGRKIVR